MKNWRRKKTKKRLKKIGKYRLMKSNINIITKIQKMMGQ